MRLLYTNFSGYSAGNQMRIRFYKEPTLSGASFSDIDSMLSVAQKILPRHLFFNRYISLKQASIRKVNKPFFLKKMV